jgi:hypothetical protein
VGIKALDEPMGKTQKKKNCKRNNASKQELENNIPKDFQDFFLFLSLFSFFP